MFKNKEGSGLPLLKTKADSGLADMAKILLILSLIVLFKLVNSQVINSIVTTLFFIIIVRSKNVLFWATLTFIYSSNPTGLFNPYTFGFDVGPVIIDISQFFILALLISTWKIKPVFKRFYLPFLGLLSIMVIINVINGLSGGFSEIRIIFRVIKMLLPLSFIFIFPRVIRNENDFIWFFRMVFPFVLISFAAQLLVFVLGIPPAVALFGWENETTGKVLDEIVANEDLSRYAFSVLIETVSLMGCLYYLNVRGNPFNKYYLGLILFACFFSVLLSGTRSWTVGFGTAIILWSLFSLKRVKKFLLPGLGVIFLVFLIRYFSPIINQQLDMAMTRISTVELFVKGDITAGETSSRFDVRGPSVMKAFHTTNPLIGTGYSEYFFEHSDGHVGHQTLLLQSGYLGYLMLNLFIVFMILKQLQQYFLSKAENSHEALAASSLVLLGLYIIFPGLAIFSYMASPETGTFYGVYLTFAGYFSHKTKIEDALIRLKEQAEVVR